MSDSPFDVVRNVPCGPDDACTFDGHMQPAQLCPWHTALSTIEAEYEKWEKATRAAQAYVAALSDVNLGAVVDARVLDLYRVWQRASADAILSALTKKEEGSD